MSNNNVVLGVRKDVNICGITSNGRNVRALKCIGYKLKGDHMIFDFYPYIRNATEAKVLNLKLHTIVIKSESTSKNILFDELLTKFENMFSGTYDCYDMFKVSTNYIDITMKNIISPTSPFFQITTINKEDPHDDKITEYISYLNDTNGSACDIMYRFCMINDKYSLIDEPFDVIHDVKLSLSENFLTNEIKE